MKKQFKILTSVWFIVGLSTLLLNDFVLKGLYGNWFTGKLSDFAGLLVFGLFWCAVFPKHIKKTLLVIGLLFVVWKSTFSQSFIDVWNTFGPFSINRIVDFTDLMALVVLLLAYVLKTSKVELKTIRIHPAISMSVAIFTFCATSRAIESYEFDKTYEFPFSKQELINRINLLNVKETENLPLSLNYQNANDFESSYYDTLWYYNSKIDTIIDSIKTAKRFKNIDSLSEYKYQVSLAIDTIIRCSPYHRDSIYVKDNYIFEYNIIQERYNIHDKQSYQYSTETRLKVLGSYNFSSLTLLRIDSDSYAEDRDLEKDSLIQDFEKYFINKLK
jgi:hypothetical protein